MLEGVKNGMMQKVKTIPYKKGIVIVALMGLSFVGGIAVNMNSVNEVASIEQTMNSEGGEALAKSMKDSGHADVRLVVKDRVLYFFRKTVGTYYGKTSNIQQQKDAAKKLGLETQQQYVVLDK